MLMLLLLMINIIILIMTMFLAGYLIFKKKRGCTCQLVSSADSKWSPTSWPTRQVRRHRESLQEFDRHQWVGLFRKILPRNHGIYMVLLCLTPKL